MAYVYILKTTAQKYYIGSTDHLEQRIQDHKTGRVRSTKYSLPVELVFKEYFPTRSGAQLKEYKIKRWKSRKMILLLIDYYKNQL